MGRRTRQRKPIVKELKSREIGKRRARTGVRAQAVFRRFVRVLERLQEQSFGANVSKK